MIKGGLQNKLIIFFVSLFSCIQAIIFIAVFKAAEANVLNQLEDKLVYAASVFNRQLDERVDKKVEAVKILAADYGFRQAIATKDLPTISSTLLNLGSRIEADKVLLLSLDEELIASSSINTLDVDFPISRLIEIAEEHDYAAVLAQVENKIYEFIVVPVLAPLPIAWISIGMEVDSELVENFKSILPLAVDVSFAAEDVSGDWITVASTLSDEVKERFAALVQQLPADSFSPVRVDIGSDEYIALRANLKNLNTENSVVAILQNSVAAGMEPYHPLLVWMLFISGIGLLTSLVGGVLITASTEKSSRLEQLLSDLKKAQQQIILQEKMASIGMLTAGIAHEIKNPLNFINNFSEISVELLQDMKEELKKLLKDKAGTDETVEVDELMESLASNCRKVQEHGKRADNIVKSMLLHSRGSSVDNEETDINELVDEYLNLAYHGMRAQDSSFNIKIEKNFKQDVGKAYICPQAISRVLLNIMNNGLYAANKKKQESKDPNFSPEIKVTTEKDDKSIIIKIRDNGTGIPKDKVEKIFQPFFTTKPTGIGTGLGLSISYDIIVQQHNGEIKVDSEEGEYTEFMIKLPRNAG